MVQNLTKFDKTAKKIKSYVQDVLQTISRIKYKEKYIFKKLLKSQYKEKNLKSIWGQRDNIDTDTDTDIDIQIERETETRSTSGMVE